MINLLNQFLRTEKEAYYCSCKMEDYYFCPIGKKELLAKLVKLLRLTFTVILEKSVPL